MRLGKGKTILAFLNLIIRMGEKRNKAFKLLTENGAS